MVNDKVYAMDAVCSHEGGPLEEGSLEGYNLTCPWHYAVFDIRNAKVSDQTVWATDLTPYPVKVQETTGDILLSLEAPLSSKEEQQQTTVPATTSAQETKEEEKKEKKAANEFELTLLAKQEHKDSDVMSFKFSKQDNVDQRNLEHTAGQYAFFDIGGVYDDPEGPLRHFTIASSPTENFVMISTRIRDTPYKKRLSSLEEGIKIKVRGPMGKFVLHEEDYSKPAVFLSGGIGVTPFRSMIKYATDKQLPLKIVMFDSNRNQENILYKDEFDQWANTNKNVKIIYTITEEGKEDQKSSGASEWKGESGRIDKAILTKYLNNDYLKDSIFYTCGPPAMIKAMQDLLQDDFGLTKERIKVEEFTGY